MTEGICTVEGCDRPIWVKSRGWCGTHYGRWYRAQPRAESLRGWTLEERLLRALVITDAGCWEYQKYRNVGGYGRIKIDGRMPFAHRIAYELWVGPIPDGMLVCHRCDNPPCCNPAHLFAGTVTDNVHDMIAKGRRRAPYNPWRGLGQMTKRRLAASRLQATVDAGVPPDWKRCPRCQTFKEPAAFARSRKESDGFQCYCRSCSAEIQRERKGRDRRGVDV